MFLMQGVGALSFQVPKHPFNGKWGEVAGASKLPSGSMTRGRGARDASK